jgi:hypothetical protein
MSRGATAMDNTEFEEVMKECGVQVDSKSATHFAEPPPGGGWELVRWTGKLNPNGDPRFSVAWRRPKNTAHRRVEQELVQVDCITIHFDDHYDENVRLALAHAGQRHPTMDDEAITIETSCGKVFRQPLVEMSDWQLRNLINQNPEEPETELVRAELQRREELGQPQFRDPTPF